MWLVLCASSDHSALWAYRGLQVRGLTPLHLISAEMLAYSLRWEHRLQGNGVSLRFTLPDGRIIRSDEVQGVLNRLTYVPISHLQLANPSDREYAAQELLAFFMSWLYALPQPVLNRPTPQGLCGRSRHASEWVWLASHAGLPTPRYRQTSHGDDRMNAARLAGKLVPSGTPVVTLIVVKGQVVGAPAPPAVVSGCRWLAELAESDLLGVEFAQAPTRWTFAGATPVPDLRLGGSAVLDALALALKG